MFQDCAEHVLGGGQLDAERERQNDMISYHKGTLFHSTDQVIQIVCGLSPTHCTCRARAQQQNQGLQRCRCLHHGKDHVHQVELDLGEKLGGKKGRRLPPSATKAKH